MATRRKERPLTLDEIKEKLTQSTHEYWMHGEPLCAYTPLIDGGKLIPLSPKAENSILAIFFLDVGDYATDRVLEILGKWQDRYRKLPWTPVFAFQAKYLFQKNPRFFDRFRHFSSFQALPLFIDQQNEWFQFFQAKGASLVFSQNGNTLFKTHIQPNFEEQMEFAERKLQEIFHVEDPGLPLLDVEPIKLSNPIDHTIRYSTELTQSGYWTNAGDSIATDDPNAKLTIPFSGTHLRLIAVTHPQARENTKAQVFLDETPIPASMHGAQVHPGDRGQSVIEINKYNGIYEILKSDRKIQGTVTIKFLNALENPVVAYELRIV